MDSNTFFQSVSSGKWLGPTGANLWLTEDRLKQDMLHFKKVLFYFISKKRNSRNTILLLHFY
ncbi:hypothetical protein CPC197_0626 [Chlamydia psittaci C1/97]|nr:hypothetical protein CP09DC77_0952 [Chlamydia psittaci 09DC77]EPP31755.1 hypothetical protein CPC197_0626 [Chlamydia psittaci C1/97]